MAKYGINSEAVELLNTLSQSLGSSMNDIVAANRNLKSQIIGMMDELGIYGMDIYSLVLKMGDICESRGDDIELLSQKLQKKASDIESLLALGLDGGMQSGVVSEGGQFARVNQNGSSSTYNRVRNSLERKKVEHNPISFCGNNRSFDEIVSSLGGGDETDGSCSSLAFAYAGNKAGYNVLDFRDGNSREYFSSNSSISQIAELPGVDSKIVYGKDDVSCADQLLSEMQSNKEYYLATGQHAAIVRMNNGHSEYLELQSAYDNGWHVLHDERLIKRFGCGINKTDYPNFLIDVDSLAGSSEFLDILGYINTDENNQRKGESGHVK